MGNTEPIAISCIPNTLRAHSALIFGVHMTIRAQWLLAALVFATAGCASSDLVASRTIGPLTGSFRADAQSTISGSLRDPASAIFDEWSAPAKLVCHGAMVRQTEPREVWAVQVTVNAKNGYGGYTGPQPYTVLFTEAEGATPPMIYSYQMTLAGMGAACRPAV